MFLREIQSILLEKFSPKSFKLNSEIYGLPTDLPFGFEFVRDRLYDSNTGELLPTVARHPTQLYEAISYLIIV